MTHSRHSATGGTVADLIRELGVPAKRIRMFPPPGTATERDLIRINDRKEGLCELVEGTLVEKPVGYREGFLALRIGRILAEFVESLALGLVSGADSEHRLRRGLVRLPDVSFVSWDQLPNRKIPEESVPDLYPDLAVEIFSRSNTRREMARKRREYFRAGCRLVWIVYPKTETIEVYTTPTEFETSDIDDILSGGDVLPGLKLPVRKIFAPPPTSPKPRNGKSK
jgi:Uma2 family endonuclease